LVIRFGSEKPNLTIDKIYSTTKILREYLRSLSNSFLLIFYLEELTLFLIYESWQLYLPVLYAERSGKALSSRCFTQQKMGLGKKKDE
jgi:hypothetical protein